VTGEDSGSFINVVGLARPARRAYVRTESGRASYKLASQQQHHVAHVELHINRSRLRPAYFSFLCKSPKSAAVFDISDADPLVDAGKVSTDVRLLFMPN
jgi:hypothetical protein